MEIVFAAITKQKPGGPYSNMGLYYPGMVDAFRAAEARSGCRVWVICDRDVPCQRLVPLSDCWEDSARFLEETRSCDRGHWSVGALCRWLVIREFAMKHLELTWPILALDYDVLVFSDLTTSFLPFAGYDWTAPNYGNGTSAAYSVGGLNVLDDQRRIMFEMAKTVHNLNDMAVWTEVLHHGTWKFGNLLDEVEGGFFDPTMHQSNGYADEPAADPIWGPTTKRITWKDGYPYFTRLTDGQLIHAHWIHCWGSYKNRTHELIQKAGL